MKTETSISDLTGKEQEALSNIKNKVIEYLPSLLIFSFDSQSTQFINRRSFTSKGKEENWEFSCNLLIVVSSDTMIESETKKGIEDAVAPYGKVNVFVHPLDVVIQKLKEHNLFFTWVQRSATLLFNKDDSWQALPTAINKRQEYQLQAEQYFNENPNFEHYLDVKIMLVEVEQPSEEKETQPSKEGEEQPSEEGGKQLTIQRVPIDISLCAEDLPQPVIVQTLPANLVANPYLVIHEFCRDFHPQETKKYIEGWMRGLYETISWIKKSPYDLIYFAERFYHLIEAAWIVHQKDNSNSVANLSLQYEPDEIDFMDSDLYCDKRFKDATWEYFPRSLNKKEFINPYKVFSKFFKYLSIDQWKAELHNIFHLALCNDDLEHTGESINTCGIAIRLKKLMEACDLINVREIEWYEGKLVFKTFNELPNE